MRSNRGNVDAGQRYRETRSGFLGRAGPVWSVVNVFTGTDGLQYARLVSEADPSLEKSISAAVLADKRRFLYVGGK
jgi:hypothetical protein